MAASTPGTILTSLFPAIRRQKNLSDAYLVSTEQNTILLKQLAGSRILNQRLTTSLNLAISEVATLAARLELLRPGASPELEDTPDDAEFIYEGVRKVACLATPSLESLIGRKVVHRMVMVMESHFKFMMATVFNRFDSKMSEGKRYETTMVMLSHLLHWVFGIFVEDQRALLAPKMGISQQTEIACLIKSAMMVRAFVLGDFPLDLMFTFLVQWNSFAVEEIGAPGLPIIEHMQLGHLQFIEFSQVSCRLHVAQRSRGSSNSLVIQLRPIEQASEKTIAAATGVPAAADTTPPSAAADDDSSASSASPPPASPAEPVQTSN